MSMLSDPPAKVKSSRRRRAEAFAALTLLWQVSTLERVRSCRHWSVRPSGSATLRRSTGADGRPVAGLAGLASCGSVWSCPVCSRRIAAERQAEVSTAVDRWQQRGGVVALLTLTMRHRRGQPLDVLWQRLSRAWHAVVAGRSWTSDVQRFRLGGWIRCVEVTHGRNGWHVHVHALLFLRDPAVDLRSLQARLCGRWSAAVERLGGSALPEYAVDLRILRDVSRFDYFSKQVYPSSWQAGLELVRHDLKRGRRRSRTPFEVLADFMRTGDVEDLAVWREWERASKGRRQLLWSKALRQILDLGRERTDDEIAATETGTALDDMVVLPRETVSAVCYCWSTLLDLAEDGGLRAVTAWLDARGYAWLPPWQPSRVA